MLCLVALFVLLYKVIVIDGVHVQEDDATKKVARRRKSSALEEFLTCVASF